ncbi:hypothetical protein NC651_028732 [Populus alba x Populus x berolinensis]|nr:hypothetical protein NC651_028732 [Populus alba x Populus x berolinensis]
MGAALVARMDKIFETVSMPRGITAPCRDKKGCSIEETSYAVNVAGIRRSCPCFGVFS